MMVQNAWRLNRRCDRFWLAAFIQESLTAIHLAYNRNKDRDWRSADDHTWFRGQADKIMKRVAANHFPTTPIVWRFIFDETVWPPADAPDRYGKRGVLCVKPVPSPEYFSFRIDFDKQLDEGVAAGCLTPSGCTVYDPINIFYVEFREGA